jgi:hypothetical protein
MQFLYKYHLIGVSSFRQPKITKIIRFMQYTLLCAKLHIVKGKN